MGDFFLFLFLCVLVAAVVAGAIYDSRVADQMMSQCLADGHKEYECHAMLDDHSNYVPMPIIITN